MIQNYKAQDGRSVLSVLTASFSPPQIGAANLLVESTQHSYAAGETHVGLIVKTAFSETHLLCL